MKEKNTPVNTKMSYIALNSNGLTYFASNNIAKLIEFVIDEKGCEAHYETPINDIVENFKKHGLTLIGTGETYEIEKN